MERAPNLESGLQLSSCVPWAGYLIMSRHPQNLWGAELGAPALEKERVLGGQGWTKWGDFRTLNWDVSPGCLGMGDGQCGPGQASYFKILSKAGPRREEPSTIVLLGHLGIQMTPAGVVSSLCTSGGQCDFSTHWNICLLWLASVGEIDTDSSDRQRENAVVCFLIPKMLFRVKNLKCHHVIYPLKKVVLWT